MPKASLRLKKKPGKVWKFIKRKKKKPVSRSKTAVKPAAPTAKPTAAPEAFRPEQAPVTTLPKPVEKPAEAVAKPAAPEASKPEQAPVTTLPKPVEKPAEAAAKPLVTFPKPAATPAEKEETAKTTPAVPETEIQSATRKEAAAAVKTAQKPAKAPKAEPDPEIVETAPAVPETASGKKEEETAAPKAADAVQAPEAIEKQEEKAEQKTEAETEPVSETAEAAAVPETPEALEEPDVRLRAYDLLARGIQKKSSIEDIEKHTKIVLNALKPEGLEALDMVPNDKSGKAQRWAIVAKAGPAEELMIFKSAMPMADQSDAVSAVAITLSEELSKVMPILSEFQEAKAVGSSADKKELPTKEYIRPGEHGALGATGEAAEKKLKKERKRASIPGAAAHQGSAGALFLPERKDTKVVELMTWNQGSDYNKKASNVSHAEAQFVHWFNGRPDEFKAKVVKIEIINKPDSPCDHCCKMLDEFAGDLKRNNKNKLIEFKISWSKPYRPEGITKPLRTTAKSLEMLEQHWITSGPLPADKSQEIEPDSVGKIVREHR